ncbi:Xanthine and CO dehydrogenases maturation factor, XdhC/CoxF family [Lachnospiraceae bacterium TWA4]|nr:Xanthine and CO dehydrogenases maturation factor, XdhC/CoxF family [Lachnospiraceae bacterium TWA4]
MKILIKGAGDLATGVAITLMEAGHQVILTEIAIPLTVRRQVAFSKAVYEGEAQVEKHCASLVSSYEEACKVLNEGKAAVIVDENANIRHQFKPDVLVDAIIAKKNLGTTITDAPIVIGLGPGFEAGVDVHAVIETMRGKTLGCPIYKGKAISNTGVPGKVGGYDKERLIKATGEGIIEPIAKIGEIVKKDQLLAITGGSPVYAQVGGIIRGMLQRDVMVHEGMKIGDVDPRSDESLVYIVSDKSRIIGNGVVKAIKDLRYKDYGMVILAAGKSSRFGSNKLVYDIQGKAMIEHLFDTLNEFPACKRVVVTRFKEIANWARSCGMEVVINEDSSLGISHSLQLGLSECKGTKGVLFTVSDQPWIRAKTIWTIFDTASKNPGKIVGAGTSKELKNPVFFDKKWYEELMSLTGDIGGKKVANKHIDDVIICKTNDKELLDIDYPLDCEDLA